MLVRIKECFSVRVKGRVFTYMPSIRIIDVPDNHINDTTRKYVELIKNVESVKVLKKGKQENGERFKFSRASLPISRNDTVEHAVTSND